MIDNAYICRIVPLYLKFGYNDLSQRITVIKRVMAAETQPDYPGGTADDI